MQRERFYDWIALGLVPITGMALAFSLLLQGHALVGWAVASAALCVVLYYVSFAGGKKLRNSEIAARIPACLFSPPLLVWAFGGVGGVERVLALAACLVVILLPFAERRLYQPTE